MLAKWMNRPALLLPLALSIAYLAPSAIMPLVWLSLRSVQVTDATTAMDAWVQVDRTIRTSFYGRFQVTFRDAATRQPVCTPPTSPEIKYEGGLSGEINRPLWWWTGGKAALRACEDEGLADGQFYAVTCQDVVAIWGGSIARRCVQSNVFTLGSIK